MSKEPIVDNLVLKGEPHYFLRKGDFTGKSDARSSDYATWDWVLKRKYPQVGSEEGRFAPISLQPIRVIVWDQPDKGPNRGLVQEFTPDKEGTKRAHQYARIVVEKHGVLLSSVETRANLPMKYDKAVEFTNYELIQP
jgi:hypothetical protein